jgi:hypothetical protein
MTKRKRIMRNSPFNLVQYSLTRVQKAVATREKSYIDQVHLPNFPPEIGTDSAMGRFWIELKIRTPVREVVKCILSSCPTFEVTKHLASSRTSVR